MKTLQYPRQVLIPRIFLNSEHDHITPKAQDEAEIARRRALPPGTLKYEFEREGLRIFAGMTSELATAEDTRFATRLLGACAFNTAWYDYAKDAEVTRRSIALPPLYNMGDLQVDRSTLLVAASMEATFAQVPANILATRHDLSDKNRTRAKYSLGCHMARASMFLAGADALRIGEVSDDPSVTQRWAKESAMKTQDNALHLHHEIGSHPSIAGLAYPDSDTSVFIRRNAPAHVVESFRVASSRDISASNERCL